MTVVCEIYSAAPLLGPIQVMLGGSGRLVSPETQPHFTLAVISTMAMVSFSFLVGITRVQLCWCALWSLPLCHGTSGGRACGMPTSLPLSSGIPFPSTLPGWSTVLLTCMATDLTTSTSTPGRTPLLLWEPLVSVVALGRALQTEWHTPFFTLVLALGTCNSTLLGSRVWRRLEPAHPGGRLCCYTDGALIEIMLCSLGAERCSQ